MRLSSDQIWVAVRVSDGSSDTAEYLGRVAAHVFQQIIANELTTGWFLLESVIWESDGGNIPQGEGGRDWGYGDVSYFRIESIARIIPLTDSFVQRLTSPQNQ